MAPMAFRKWTSILAMTITVPETHTVTIGHAPRTEANQRMKIAVRGEHTIRRHIPPAAHMQEDVR